MLDTLGRWADDTGFSSAVLDLSGVQLAAFDYVMPDRADDDRHAAWYSDTHSSKGTELEEAIAILGWRDGAWFAHIHAYWRENNTWHLGHLLPETLRFNDDANITGHGLVGARFEASLDPETEFTLFRVTSDRDAMSGKTANALITTLAPFTDLYEGITALGNQLPGDGYSVHGLGSLAGSHFEDGPPMTGLISEILLQNGAAKPQNGKLSLPLRTVDLNKGLFQGHATPGKCPTLVTNELLLVAQN
ncbi:PPC domain-containing DNA-binding protein [Roseibium alexandrii]|uniref:hypothetical protein n=1 Tax=Roseibium alexandrii TaxID=388408 RepID=UPI0001947E78|nr:hypothetical protein [Roseibium alexandrii]